MDPAPPPPFEVIETNRGRTYRLPPRRIVGLRVVALVPAGMVAILGVCLAKFYVKEVAQQAADSWYWAVFAVLLLGWAVIAYSMLDLAASLWCGHAEIEVAPDGMVSAYDRAGWFGICLCWFKRTAARLILTELCSPKERPRDVWSRLVVGLWQLSVEGEDGKKGWLALGYPRKTLAALAEQLARELALAPPDSVETAAPAAPAAAQEPVALIAEPGFPNRDVTVQPLASRAELERHPDGVTVTIPRVGLKGPNVQPFCLGAFFAAIAAPLTVMIVASWITQGNLVFWPGLVIALGLLALGLGLMAYWFNAGRKKVVLAVVGDRLLSLETGPLGSTRREFARADLLDITCRPNEQLPDLLIVTNDRATVAMLAGHDEGELRWVATVLRQALGIPAEPPECRMPPGTADKPWISRRRK